MTGGAHRLDRAHDGVGVSQAQQGGVTGARDGFDITVFGSRPRGCRLEGAPAVALETLGGANGDHGDREDWGRGANGGKALALVSGDASQLAATSAQRPGGCALRPSRRRRGSFPPTGDGNDKADLVAQTRSRAKPAAW